MMASLSLAACEIPVTGTDKAVQVNAASILSRVPEVENSTESPCWQQRQIAAQRSYIRSVTKGKTVRYHADCADQAPASKTEPKSS